MRGFLANLFEERWADLSRGYVIPPNRVFHLQPIV